MATGVEHNICKRNRRRKNQSRLGKINFKLKAIISTSKMSSTVALAQLERMNGMIE